MTQIDISKFQTSKGLNLGTVNSIQNQTHQTQEVNFEIHVNNKTKVNEYDQKSKSVSDNSSQKIDVGSISFK